MKTIYAADDSKESLDMIRIFLSNAGYQVFTFMSVTEFLAAFQEKEADLVVLSMEMPGWNGLEICNQLRRTSVVPIIFLSEKTNRFEKVHSLLAGADDYISKPFSVAELVARVHCIFRRIAYSVGEDIGRPIQYGNIIADTEAMAFFTGDTRLKLTPLEYEFMLYLMQRPEKPVSREELLKDVWHNDVITDSRVTDDLVKRVRKKLQDAGADIYIKTVWAYGFKLTLQEND